MTTATRLLLTLLMTILLLDTPTTLNGWHPPATALQIPNQPVAPPSSSRTVTLNVVDFGINQKWNQSMRLGSDFARAANGSVKNLSSDSQILVPMFSDEIMAGVSPDVLRQRIFHTLKTKVDMGLSKGITQFEIQLVQNINTRGYFDRARQGLVDHFGAAAYGALADLNQYLKSKHVEVRNHAILGSNGTKMFAASRPHWMAGRQAIWDRVDLFDGRAYIEPISQAIDAIGAEKVQLYSTRGDWPAPHGDGPAKSTGNFNTIKDLKARHSNAQVFLLTPLNPSLWRTGAGAHISAMAKPGTLYAIQEYRGPQEGMSTLPGLVEGRDLYPNVVVPEQVRTRVQLSPETEERIVMGRDLATKWADTLLAVGEAVKEVPEFRDLMTQQAQRQLTKGEVAWLERLETTRDLAEAIQKDIDAGANGPVTLLRSHTVERVLTLGLEHGIQWYYDKHVKGNQNIPLAVRARVSGHLRRLDALRSFTTAISQHVGRGHIDEEIRNHYLDGIQALIGTRKKLAAGMMVMDAAQDVYDGLSHDGPGGARSVAAIESYGNAVVNLWWTTAALSRCGPNAACTAAVREVGVGFSEFLGSIIRAGGARVFQHQNRQKILRDYETLVHQAGATGKAVPTMSSVYGTELLRQNGFSYSQMHELDRRADRLSERMTKPDVGGVLIDVIPTAEQRDLRRQRETVLKSIRPGELSTDLPHRR